MKIEHQKDVFTVNEEVGKLLEYVNSFNIRFKYSGRFPYSKPIKKEEGEEGEIEYETQYLPATKSVTSKTIGGLLESLERSKEVEEFKMGDAITFEMGVYGGHTVLVSILCKEEIKFNTDNIELDVDTVETHYIERGTREKLPLEEYFESKTARKFKQALKLARLVQ